MTRAIGRREMLQGLAAGVGLAALPGVSDADHPVGRHLADGDRVAHADAQSNAPDWTPAFLAAPDLATLASLAELILPGAANARTAEFIDQLLAVDSPDNQRRFLNALGAFEGLARTRHGRRWTELGAVEQTAILTEASTGAQSQPPPPAWTAGQPIVHTPAPDPPPAATLRDQFDHLRGWIAGAYFSSEIGMRELGWTGNQFWEKLPGCDHPDAHAG